MDYGQEVPFTAPSWARKFNKSDFAHGRDISNSSIDYGYWWIEISYPYNNIRDNNILQDLLMQNVLGIWDYIKNSGHYPEAKTRVLNWFEWLPCKRQGRRFIGQYVQTQNDILPDPSDATPTPEYVCPVFSKFVCTSKYMHMFFFFFLVCVFVLADANFATIKCK